MSLPPRRVILTLIWIHILILGVAKISTSAQEGGQVRLAPIDTEEFPRVTSYLDVRTPEGDFVFGLERHNVRIFEDGNQLPVLELQPLRTGVQFVLAIKTYLLALEATADPQAKRGSFDTVSFVVRHF